MKNEGTRDNGSGPESPFVGFLPQSDRIWFSAVAMHGGRIGKQAIRGITISPYDEGMRLVKERKKGDVGKVKRGKRANIRRLKYHGSGDATGAMREG